MSVLRPECHTYHGPRKALPRDTSLFLIRDSVARRKSLLHGRLHYGTRHCAIGCFFHDNPDAILPSDLIDEVAAVNDSMPYANAKQRWKKVNEWLRWKIRVMGNQL